MEQKNLLDALTQFSEDIKDLHLQNVLSNTSIETISLDANFNSDYFKNNYVAKNIPVLIKGGCSHWKAIKTWDMPYFRKNFPDKTVNVAITPNGYADGIATKDDVDYFVKPYEIDMKFSEFLDNLENPKDDFICYIQRQNSNLNIDFPELFVDVDSNIPWAEIAFGGKPDAINFWMGDERAISSMHKDFYENLYGVVKGQKRFLLIPPTEVWRVPYRQYPQANFKLNETGYLQIDEIQGEELLPWISIDPLQPDFDKYPEFKDVTCYDVAVNEGDLLYLPSLWFHHVRQSHACIAVNYWFDMNFDFKYCVFKLLEKLKINER